MEERKNLDTRASALMVLLCMVLGLQQVVLKIAAPDISPIMQIALRSGLSAVLVLPLLWRDHSIHLFSYRQCKAGALVALFFSLEFYFVTQALKFTSTSHTVVLLYTAPIFVALGLHWKFPTERLNRAQWGYCSGFYGDHYHILPNKHSYKCASSSTSFVRRFICTYGWACMGTQYNYCSFISFSSSAGNSNIVLSTIWLFCSTLTNRFFNKSNNNSFHHFSDLKLKLSNFNRIFCKFTIMVLVIKKLSCITIRDIFFLTPLFGVLFSILLLEEKLEIKFIFGSILVLSGIVIMSLKQGKANSS